MAINKMINELFDLTVRLLKVDADSPLVSEWNDRVRGMDVDDLITLVSLMNTRDKETSREMKALRESVLAEIQLKSALIISETMKQLQKSANRLTGWSVVITIVGIFVGIVGIVTVVV